DARGEKKSTGRHEGGKEPDPPPPSPSSRLPVQASLPAGAWLRQSARKLAGYVHLPLRLPASDARWARAWATQGPFCDAARYLSHASRAPAPSLGSSASAASAFTSTGATASSSFAWTDASAM